MSYDITFISLNGKSVSPEEFSNIVEKLTTDPKSPTTFPMPLRLAMTTRIQKDLPYLKLQNEVGTEGPYLALESTDPKLHYNIQFYRNQISISAPYWDTTDWDRMSKDFARVGKILTHEFNLTGLDHQTGKFFAKAVLRTEVAILSPISQCPTTTGSKPPDVTSIGLAILLPFLLFRARS